MDSKWTAAALCAIISSMNESTRWLIASNFILSETILSFVQNIAPNICSSKIANASHIWITNRIILCNTILSYYQLTIWIYRTVLPSLLITSNIIILIATQSINWITISSILAIYNCTCCLSVKCHVPTRGKTIATNSILSGT